jgi:hypothetical protein
VRSKVHQVPPPVDDIVLTLRCRAIRRQTTHLRVSVRKGKIGTFVLQIHLSAGRSHQPLLGGITVRLGSRTVAMLAPGVKTGTAVFDGDGLRAGANRLTVSYGGDAELAPSLATLRVG